MLSIESGIVELGLQLEDSMFDKISIDRTVKHINKTISASCEFHETEDTAKLMDKWKEGIQQNFSAFINSNEFKNVSLDSVHEVFIVSITYKNGEYAKIHCKKEWKANALANAINSGGRSPRGCCQKRSKNATRAGKAYNSFVVVMTVEPHVPVHSINIPSFNTV